MRILIINDHLSIVGGAERLIRAIKSALEKKGHKVELLGSYEGENFASLFSRWYSKKWYKKTIQKIKEFKPDVIHVNNCIRIISPSVVQAALDSNIPVVLDPQDLSFLCPRVGGIYKKNRSVKSKSLHKCFFEDCLGYDETYKDVPRNYWRMLKLTLHRKVIKNKKIFFVSNSKFLSKAMEKSLGVKSKIINHGVKIPKEKTNYGKNIMFIGELNEEKGLLTIAKTLNEIKKYKVLILGRGIFRKSLESKYKNIQFLGFQKPEGYYKKVSIVAIPSIWMDTFPLTVLEAMSYGTCVITSKIGGIPEQIKHMKTGLLFEPGNKRDFKEKLDYLLKNPSEIKRIGKNAREFIKRNFTWDKIIKKYEKTYEEAIKHN